MYNTGTSTFFSQLPSISLLFALVDVMGRFHHCAAATFSILRTAPGSENRFWARLVLNIAEGGFA